MTSLWKKFMAKAELRVTKMSETLILRKEILLRTQFILLVKDEHFMEVFIIKYVEKDMFPIF